MGMIQVRVFMILVDFLCFDITVFSYTISIAYYKLSCYSFLEMRCVYGMHILQETGRIF